ncbi:MAG: hypothetical protein PWQ11_490 [Candidatus Diapherotrites archaeon]|nr:hypothetical protein [Candidatus Diapherotrites archaeon]
MRWIAILLILPLAMASELDDFLSVHPAVPVTVNCGDTYKVYPYFSGDALDYALVVKDGEPVFDFDQYRDVISAYLYKEHVKSAADEIRLLSPSSVPTFSSLLSKMQDEEYDLSVARNHAEECFPQFVSRIDTMETVRQSLVSDLETFVEKLGKEAQALVDYLKSPGAECGFSLDLSVYDDVASIVEGLTTYESYSKQIRADIAITETNCTPDVVQAISSALKPPFTSDQLQYFQTSAATEKEILSYRPTDDEIRALLQKTIKNYWKTLYENAMKSEVKSDLGVFSLEDAIKFVLSAGYDWREKGSVSALQEKYSEVLSLAAKGDYERAYAESKNLRELVEDVLKGGVVKEEGFRIPEWAYGIVLLLGVVILWKMLGGRGGNEEVDEGFDYSYDLA